MLEKITKTINYDILFEQIHSKDLMFIELRKAGEPVDTFFFPKENFEILRENEDLNLLFHDFWSDFVDKRQKEHEEKYEYGSAFDADDVLNLKDLLSDKYYQYTEELLEIYKNGGLADPAMSYSGMETEEDNLRELYENGEVDFDKVGKFDWGNNIYWPHGSAFPMSPAVYVDYVYGFTDRDFDLEKVQEILDGRDDIIKTEKVSIPYYNSDAGNEAIEFVIRFDQDTYEELASYHKERGEEYWYWITRKEAGHRGLHFNDVLGMSEAKK